jgi:hypothetical protein
LASRYLWALSPLRKPCTQLERKMPVVSSFLSRSADHLLQDMEPAPASAGGEDESSAITPHEKQKLDSSKNIETNFIGDPLLHDTLQAISPPRKQSAYS